MVDARDFGFATDPWQQAEEDVRPYRQLSPQQRYACFIDLMALMERIWKSIDPERQARYASAQAKLDDPGRWWERVPRDDAGGSGPCRELSDLMAEMGL